MAAKKMDQSVLLLSAADIGEMMPMSSALRTTERAFLDYHNGELAMPGKLYLTLSRFNGDFRAMPAAASSKKIAGIKWVNSHSGNPARKLPAVMALYILNDASNGLPLAILDATLLTALRTGAAGGIATKYLAATELPVAAFIGCGAQAHYQLEAIAKVRRLKAIRLYDSKRKVAEEFAAYIERILPKTKVVITASIPTAIDGALLITTTTPSRKPLILSEWVTPGCHINAIGADAPGKQELESELVLRSRIVVDDPNQATHSGEVNVPIHSGDLKIKECSLTLGAVIANPSQRRRDDDEITLFDSTGLAIQDLAMAHAIYRNAKRSAKGQRFSFW